MFLSHILLLTLSNILVQYPFELCGLHTTWGAFTYPAIFILTDLTTRLSSANSARKIIFQSMIPALVISYILSSYMLSKQGWNDIFLMLYIMPMRIALGCFVAYLVGQLLDISVFQRYRKSKTWWLAPVISTTVGNFIDTALFFTIAFYHCNNPFLSQHWIEIAAVDVFFKVAISLIAFVPLYGVVLNKMKVRITS